MNFYGFYFSNDFVNDFDCFEVYEHITHDHITYSYCVCL
jgi:hypothetical protein